MSNICESCREQCVRLFKCLEKKHLICASCEDLACKECYRLACRCCHNVESSMFKHDSCEVLICLECVRKLYLESLDHVKQGNNTIVMPCECRILRSKVERYLQGYCLECGQVIGEDYIELLNGIRLIYRCFSKIYADKRAMYNQIEKQLVKCHKCKEIQRRVNDLKETKRDGMVCNRCDKEGKSDEMERREYLEYNNIDPGMEDEQERDEQLKEKTIINAQNKINFVKQEPSIMKPESEAFIVEPEREIKKPELYIPKPYSVKLNPEHSITKPEPYMMKPESLNIVNPEVKTMYNSLPHPSIKYEPIIQQRICNGCNQRIPNTEKFENIGDGIIICDLCTKESSIAMQRISNSSTALNLSGTSKKSQYSNEINFDKKIKLDNISAVNELKGGDKLVSDIRLDKRIKEECNETVKECKLAKEINEDIRIESKSNIVVNDQKEVAKLSHKKHVLISLFSKKKNVEIGESVVIGARCHLCNKLMASYHDIGLSENTSIICNECVDKTKNVETAEKHYAKISLTESWPEYNPDIFQSKIYECNIVKDIDYYLHLMNIEALSLGPNLRKLTDRVKLLMTNHQEMSKSVREASIKNNDHGKIELANRINLEIKCEESYRNELVQCERCLLRLEKYSPTSGITGRILCNKCFVLHMINY